MTDTANNKALKKQRYIKKTERAQRELLPELEAARLQIDAIDERIAELFCDRQKLSAKIAGIKKAAGLQTLDLVREEEVMKKAERRCGVCGRELFKTIMELSKREQAKYK